MPADIAETVNNWADRFLSDERCKQAVSNPFYISVILTVAIVVIIYLYVDTYGKTMYLGMMIFAMLFVATMLMRHALTHSGTDNEATQIVGGMEESVARPRDVRGELDALFE